MGNKAEEKLKEALREALEQQIEKAPEKEQIKEIHTLPDGLYEQVKSGQRKKRTSFYKGIRVAACLACLSAAAGMLYTGNIFLNSIENKSSQDMAEGVEETVNEDWKETNVLWSMESQEGYLKEVYLKMQVQLPEGAGEEAYGPVIRVEWKQGEEWKTVYEKEDWEEQLLKGGEEKEEKLVFSEYGMKREGCYRLSRMIGDELEERIITIRKER